MKKALTTFLYSRLSSKEQIFFIKRLSFLIKAGIPTLESLKMIREQTKSKGYKRILNSIIRDVSNGQSLSGSLAKHPRAFSTFAVNIVSFGESSGILSENLEYLADELRKKQQLQKKVISAFVYPVIVIFATLGITAFLMVYLFPKIMPVFVSLNIKLPLSTRIVIFLSNFIANYGIYVAFLLVAIIIAFVFLLKKSYTAHYRFDSFILRLPLIGSILRYYSLANSTRTMGLLLKSGLTISDALPIVSRTTGNFVYRKEFKSLSKVVERGEKMSSYLQKKRNIFPDVLSQIVSVGEKSGNLSASLIYLSELYESEVDDFTKNLGSLIEPVLMIFMGLLVGFIAISIITPIYSITQNLHA